MSELSGDAPLSPEDERLVSNLVLHRVITLEPEPSSAGQARGFVREVLSAAGRPEWIERAELAVSELVTNAVVHAHTVLTVTVSVTGDDATVYVRDDSAQLPAQRHWGASATTGRGLALVASLSVTYGVETEPGGKTVWFRVDDTVGDADDQVDTWDIDGLLAELEIPAGAPAATLIGVPVLLWLAAQQHQEAVLRELFLVAADSAEDTVGLDLTAAGRAIGALSFAVERGIAEAIAEGAPLVGLPEGHPSPLAAVPRAVSAVVSVPTEHHGDFSALQDALDAGVRLGAADKLLIRPALPETVALRDWACEQVLAQANGVPPTPWGGAEHPRFVDPASARDTAPAPMWDDSTVRQSARAVLAADDNNRLISVSDAAAEMLGWTVEELTGRRVVTVVPERLREAHVAGFTRHLTTGEAHVLGVEIELPVLRRDGTEIVCRFLIERAAAGAGRAVYVAWLTPIG